MKQRLSRLHIGQYLKRIATVTSAFVLILVLTTTSNQAFAEFTTPTTGNEEAADAEDIYSLQTDSPWYDPTQTACSPVDQTANVNLNGNDNIQKAFNFLSGELVKVGDKRAALDASAMVGNFMQESNVNPGDINSIGAHGIAQWLNGRWDNLQAFAKSQNKPWDDLTLQLNFTWSELNSNKGAVLKTMLAPPADMQTIDAVTFYFQDQFEIAGEKMGDPPMVKRIEYAKQVFTNYGSSVPQTNNVDPSAATDCGGDQGAVSADGYYFPLAPRNQRDYVGLPCSAAGVVPGYPARGTTGTYTDVYGNSAQIRTCHHAPLSPAFDLMYAGVAGQDEYAITDGKIYSLNPHYCNPSSCGADGKYCNSIQFYSTKDKHYYWYGHLLAAPGIANGVTVKGGQKIGTVATADYGTKCWGGGPHLHIDRGCVDKSGTPHTGGNAECRDPAFMDLLLKIWEALPKK